MMMGLEDILRDAVIEGVIECEECGNRLEPDADGCYCGWKNPLKENGMI
jgi:hypothetical protein